MTNTGLANDCTPCIREHCVLLYENGVLAEFAEVDAGVTSIFKRNQI